MKTQFCRNEGCKLVFHPSPFVNNMGSVLENKQKPPCPNQFTTNQLTHSNHGAFSAPEVLWNCFDIVNQPEGKVLKVMEQVLVSSLWVGECFFLNFALFS